MKNIRVRLVTVLFFSAVFFSGAQTRPELLLLPVETNAAQRAVIWSAEPGIRYALQQSTNLVIWSTVAGFPSKAEALAKQQLVEMQAAPKRFFRVLVLDEQPPGMTSQIPADGSFGVRRFSSIAGTLADATGINSSSVRLTVGAHGTFSTSSPQLTWSTNSFRFDLGGDTALGGYGETVQATLTVADTMGNTTNYVWSFELEKAIETATNLFVFGSPDAQRAGQQLSGAAAVLAARYSSGPVRMSGTAQEWTIDTVTTNSIVLAYTSASAPAFTAGQLLANLAPAHISEIFYRRIDSLSNDSGAKKLTLYTTEVTLADVMIKGSFTIGDDAVFLDFDENGNLIRALSGDATFQLPDIGADFSGQTIISEGALNLSLQEGKFLLHPKLKISWETDLFLKRVDAQISGDLEISCVPLARSSGSWSGSPSKELWTRSHWVGEGIIYVELKYTITAKASVNLSSSAELKSGFRQNGNLGISAKYVRGTPFVPPRRWFNLDPLQQVPFTYTVNGNGSATVSLVPQIDARLFGAAGFYVDTDPRLEISGAATMVNGTLTEADWLLGAYADVNAGLSVIGVEQAELPGLSFRFFTREWSVHYPTSGPPVIVRQPLSQTALIGDPAIFSVEAMATNTLSYQWFQNGQLIPGQTQKALSYGSVGSGHQGNYQVIVSVAGQSTNSSIAVLSVVTNGIAGPTMVRIPGGTNSGTDPHFGAYSRTVSTFYMDRTEVTKAQWDTVYNWAIAHGYSFDNAGSGKAANHPVQTVSWYDIVKWCNARSQMEGRTPCYTVSGSTYKTGQSEPDCNFSASGYRLPTSAEWEYAARGGLSSKRFPWGDTIQHTKANYYSEVDVFSYDTSSTRGCHPTYGTSGGIPYTSPVGSFSANGYGLYDMAGNVWEWSTDESGWFRFIRGGCWFSDALSAHCGYALGFYPDDPPDYRIGFRCVCR